MKLADLYLAGFAIYGAIVAGAMDYVARQSGAGPHARLVREVFENDRIGEADLVPVDQAEIARHYARRHMLSGAPITPADVAEQKFPAPKPSVAVLASYDSSTRLEPLKVDDKVRLCLDGVPVQADPVAVAAVECDGPICTATLPLPEIPRVLQEETAVTRLRLVDAADDCGGK